MGDHQESLSCLGIRVKTPHHVGTGGESSSPELIGCVDFVFALPSLGTSLYSHVNQVFKTALSLPL